MLNGAEETNAGCYRKNALHGEYGAKLVTLAVVLVESVQRNTELTLRGSR